MLCVHGDEVFHPSAHAGGLETDSWARTVTVALSVEVPVDVLLGIRDCSAGQEFKECLITTRAQKRDQLNDSLS